MPATRIGIPSRRTASKNSGHRSSGIVEQKSLATNLVKMIAMVVLMMLTLMAMLLMFLVLLTLVMLLMVTINLSTMASMVLGSTSWSREAWVDNRIS